MALTALCGTRIYFQPFSNHLEAYLNREIALGILAMVALRQYTDAYGVTTVTLIEIGIAIFLPPCFHLIRWTKENYHKHKDTIHEVISKGSWTGSRSSRDEGSKAARNPTQSATQSQTASGITQRSRIATGAKGSIEKLNLSSRSALRSGNVTRKTSMNGVVGEATPLNPDQMEYSLPSA
ncbi:hypothetical protein BCR33DRAFT_734843 [Rhizoclosmatium globosum]|uniref:Uncharacterized protein n=1 Tax=Rhizoclosmatium globosum TaxID=329046 RepID=A0A1Y2CR79_9FUNG|nr:hypothetical protein BCR33DRAFT_734843 [Rhizoclosmatium globosum]|eukprot:ORY49344.1 hypothetical protein BCR33DRAFT_734843 [Rhizoclosmatium globosum]